MGSRFAYLDIDLAQYGERVSQMRDIIAALSLPVLVDADNGYGDVKNVHSGDAGLPGDGSFGHLPRGPGFPRSAAATWSGRVWCPRGARR